MLSPNDVRREEGWPASSDPTANSIELPVAGGKAAEQPADEPAPPSPPPPADDGGAADDSAERTQKSQS